MEEKRGINNTKDMEGSSQTHAQKQYYINVDINENKKLPCILYHKKIKRCSCKTKMDSTITSIAVRIMDGDKLLQRFICRWCTECKKVYIPFTFFKEELPIVPSNIDELPAMKEARRLRLERKKARKEAQQKKELHKNNYMDYSLKQRNVNNEKIPTVNYCMVTLKEMKTGKVVKYTMTNGSAYETKDVENKFIPAGCELGQLCLRAAANDYESIEYKDSKYLVMRYVRYDAVYVDSYIEKVPKTVIKKQPVEQYGMNVQGKEQLIHVYFRLSNTCIRDKHNVVNVTMAAKNVKTGGKIDVNVYKCITCGKYFINYEVLQDLFNKKMYPAFQYYIVESSWGDLKPISKLMLYGYTVREGVLSIKDRRNILSYIIDNALMSKAEIIHNIQAKIDFNGKKKGNERAKECWKEDILFVSTYGTSNQTRINGRFVRD